MDLGETLAALRDFKIMPKWVSQNAASVIFKDYFVMSRDAQAHGRHRVGMLTLSDFKEVLARLGQFIFTAPAPAAAVAATASLSPLAALLTVRKFAP